MTAKMLVYSDYVCPYCMLSEQIIEQAVAGKDITVEWRPFELRPEPTPTLRPEDDYLPAVWARSVYPMAKRLGVPIVLPKVSPQPYTHLAFEGACFAAEHGKADEYHAAMFRAFFQQERDIGEIDVLVDVAAGIGLPAEEFRAALVDRRYADEHRRAYEHALNEVQIRAVPTIIVGRHRIDGVPDRDRLTMAVDLAIAEANESVSQ